MQEIEYFAGSRRLFGNPSRSVAAALLLASFGSSANASPPQQVAGVCSRTPEVITWILAQTGDTDCADVTEAELNGITAPVSINGYSNPTLLRSDFAGLTGVLSVDVAWSPALKRVPADAFAELTKGNRPAR